MQQINLYRPEFRPNSTPMRSVHMLWGVLAFIGLLILFSVHTSRQNNELEQQLLNAQSSLQVQQGELQKMTALQSQQQPAQLDAEIERLQQNIARRQQLLSLILDQDFGNNHGFSSHLQGLARQSLETLALESFSLQHGGHYIEMAGKTYRPDQVPLYIQRLRNEDSFSKARFGVLNVERDTTGASALSFQVAKPVTREGRQ